MPEYFAVVTEYVPTKNRVYLFFTPMQQPFTVCPTTNQTKSERKKTNNQKNLLTNYKAV
jgi:hypothetical protein